MDPAATGHADFPLAHGVVWVGPGVAQRGQSPTDWAQHTGAAAITCRAEDTDQLQLLSGSAQKYSWESGRLDKSYRGQSRFSIFISTAIKTREELKHRVERCGRAHWSVPFSHLFGQKKKMATENRPASSRVMSLL